MNFRPAAAAITALAYLATPGQSPAEELTWSEIEAALERHPALRAAAADITAAEAEIVRRRQIANPEIGMSLGHARGLDGPEQSLIWGIDLQIPIEPRGVYSGGIEAAKAEQRAVRFAAALLRLEVERTLKGLLCRLAIGEESLAVHSRNLDDIDRLIETARRRVEQGEARPVEVTRLGIAREKIAAAREGVRQELAALREALGLWLGRRLPPDVRVVFEWRDLPAVPSLEGLAESASARHPALLVALQQVSAAEAAAKAERHRRAPDLAVGGFYHREPDVHAFGATLGLTLPVWNWNRGGIAKAQAEAVAAGHRRELTRTELLATLHQAHAAARTGADLARRYRDHILPRARQAAQTVQALYQAGETDLLDLLEARRSLNETENELLAAFEEGWLAWLDLITLAGGPHE
jgi:cobalt-zinc-cadmium efflux system outer membrane protein